MTAALLGPAFRLEDAAEMLSETPATLLPAVQEAMDAAIMTAAEHAFAVRHQLLRRAVSEMIPALAVAAANSAGLARSGPARLAQAAAQHPDPWARASPPKPSPSS